jgi:hypothetical protein
MAVSASYPQSPTFGLNHRYIRFSSTSGFKPEKATIKVTDKTVGSVDIVTVTIYPDISGQFIFDTYAVLKSLFSNRSEDAPFYEPLESAPADVSLYKELRFDLEIFFSDSETTETDFQNVVFIKGTQQPDKSPSLLTGSANAGTGAAALFDLPVKFWNGYPFEIAYLSDTDEIKRYVVSSGEIGDIGDTGNFPDLKRVNLSKPGIYLKWFNGKGGFSYWLFDCVFQQNTSSKNTGVYNKPYIASFRPVSNETYTLDMAQKHELTLHDTFSIKQKRFINSLLASNEVYLYYASIDTLNAYETFNTNFLRVRISDSEVEYNTKTGQLEVLIALETDVDVDLDVLLADSPLLPVAPEADFSSEDFSSADFLT